MSPPPPSATPWVIAADLVLRGAVGGDQVAASGLVEREPRRGEPDRADLDRLLGERPHPVQILGRRGLAVGAASSHHIHPQRRVRQISGDVDVALSRLHRIEVLGERLPIPWQAVDHHHAGDVLHAGHHVDEDVVVLGATGREANAAVAHHRGRHAVRRRRRHAVGPDGLPVVMGMEIDKTGCDEESGRVDLAGSVPVHSADGRDDAVADRDIADERLTAEAVDDGAVADDQVVAHLMNLRPWRGSMPG